MRSPVLVDRFAAAAILGVSVRTFHRLLEGFDCPLYVWCINNRRHFYRKSEVQAMKKRIQKNKKALAEV